MTRTRTLASVPFGCRYRLIDFALSNMVNSGITHVGVITHYNYQSLLDHIGTGKDWDLARRSGGIKIIPPFAAVFDSQAANKLYTSRLEAMMGATSFLNHCTEDYVVLSDCDVICNIDLNAVIADHIASGADVTMVTKRVDPAKTVLNSANFVTKIDESGRITDFAEYTPTEDEVDVSTNIMVMRRDDMLAMIHESAAHGYTSYFRDVISRTLHKQHYHAYRYDGYYAYIGSLEGYFAVSMSLLRPEARDGLFNMKNRPIMTKVRNSAPTRYMGTASVTNSYVADGCVIEGTVENSILFRGVRVGRGTVIRNSILLQDTYTGSNVSLNCVVSDKNVIIKDGRVLSGHESMPFYIGKGIMV